MQVESNLDSTSEEAPDVETPEPEVDPVDTELYFCCSQSRVREEIFPRPAPGRMASSELKK